MRLGARVLTTAPPPSHAARREPSEAGMGVSVSLCNGGCGCAEACAGVDSGARDNAWPRRRGRRRSSWTAPLLAATGALLLVVGAFTAILLPFLFEYILQKELSITPTSTSFKMWKDTPVPILLKFYFFNWTNPEDIRVPGTKPILVEMGPYVFREEHEKVDVEWNPNGTLSFRQIRRWYFDEKLSNGSLDDNVTTLNVIALTAAFHSRYWGYLMKTSLSLSLRGMGQELQVTHTVRELLFDGYSSPLITMAKSMPSLADINVPYDRFGWFYSRNGSEEYDGLFTMHTGADDLGLVGKLSRWNGNNRTSFFAGDCGRVNGSAGELWPPGRTRDSVEMFSPDLCRSIDLQYERNSAVHGVNGFEYAGGSALLGNESQCFCGGQCVRAGVLNVSTCRFGAPAFVSYPHFLYADPWYNQQVEGLHPDADRHRFFLTLEPITGIPLDVAARFQINLLLQPHDHVSLLEGVPHIFFPMCWFEERATLSPDMARSLSLLLSLPRGGVVVAALVAATGGMLLACAAILWRRPAARFEVMDIPLKSPAKGSSALRKREVDSELEILHNTRNEKVDA